MKDDLRNYKQRKKFEKVCSDIPELLKVLALFQRALSVFKAYVAVQELVSVVSTHRILLESQLKKYQAELEKMRSENE